MLAGPTHHTSIGTLLSRRAKKRVPAGSMYQRLVSVWRRYRLHQPRLIDCLACPVLARAFCSSGCLEDAAVTVGESTHAVR